MTTTPTEAPVPANPTPNPTPNPEPTPAPVPESPALEDAGSLAPLYVPKRSECNAALEESKAEYAKILSDKWDVPNMTCSHGSHIEDVVA